MRRSPVPILDNDDIGRLYDAATTASLGDRRHALLANIDRHFVNSLEMGNTVAGQLMMDLGAMNSAELADETIPLVTWLDNAIRLAGGRVETAVFREARARCWPLRDLEIELDTETGPPDRLPVRRLRTTEPWLAREVDHGVRVLAISPAGGGGLAALESVLAERIAAGEVEWLDPAVGPAARQPGARKCSLACVASRFRMCCTSSPAMAAMSRFPWRGSLVSSGSSSSRPATPPLPRGWRGPALMRSWSTQGRSRPKSPAASRRRSIAPSPARGAAAATSRGA